MKIKKNFIISCDFDETLAKVPHFPKIEGLTKGAKKYVNRLYDEGNYIIINTCRTGSTQDECEEFLKEEGIKYHQINENHPLLIEYFNNNSRKISADWYVDDKGLWLFGIPSWFWLYWIIRWKQFRAKKTLLTQFKVNV